MSVLTHKLVSEQLLLVVRKFAGENVQISGETQLYKDLCISGDDAAELISQIEKIYGVSFRNFRFDNYFPNEGEAAFYPVAKLFGYRSKKLPFRFGDLVDAIMKGKWQ